MRSHIFAALASIFMFSAIASSALGQPAKPMLLPSCGGVYGLCGFIDRQSKATVIPFKFERVMPFSQGLAGAKINGQFGFINESGEIVIEPQFNLVGRFHQGLAEVLVNNKAGVINKQGMLVLEPRFSRAIPFTKDVVIAVEGKWGNNFFPGHKKLWGLSHGLYTGNKKSGLFHLEHGWVLQPKYYFSLFAVDGKGLVWATTQSRSTGPFGLMRADGTWQIEPVFTHVQRLSDGRAIAKKDSRLGALDEHGQVAIPFEHKALGYWRNGYGLTGKGKLHGLLDRDGNLVAGRYFEKARRPVEGGLPKVMLNGLWKSVRPDGSLVDDESDGREIASCERGLTAKLKSGKVQFLKADQEPVGDWLFDNLHYQQGNFDCISPISVRSNGKWGFITQSGKMLTEPLSFNNQSRFVDGHAGVARNKKWGVIDLQGNFVIRPKYDRLRPRKGGLFHVTLNKRNYWIDINDNEVAAPPRPKEDNARFLNCRGGTVLFAKEDLWGMSGPDGKEIIKPVHRALYCYRNGTAWAPVDARRRWCPIGIDGEFQKNVECRKTYYPYIQTHSYPEKFHSDAYESNVLWVRAFLDYGLGKRATAPRMVSDGIQPSHSIIRQ